MISFQQARQIANTELSTQRLRNNDSLVIVDERIIEKEYAWIFPYTSKKCLETNDIYCALAGNGPLFISKVDGQISTYRTGLSIEGMIDEHEEVNGIWCLFLWDNNIDARSLILLKKTFGWTLERLAELKASKEKLLDCGSKKRLTQLRYALALRSIKTKLALKESFNIATNH